MDETVSDRVRAVISAASTHQAAFAQRVGITPDKLSKSLSGVRRFTSLELALIADAADSENVTVDWLLTGRTPVPTTLAARTSALASPERATLDDVTRRFAAAYDVLDLLGRAGTLPRLPDPRAEDLRYAAQGAALAKEARIRLSTVTPHSSASEAPVESWYSAFGVDVAVIELPTGLSGLAWQSTDFRLIFASRSDIWTRQRFTLAHELGHILAQDSQGVLVEPATAPGTRSEPSEIRANSFASNFLMPEDEVRSAVNALGGLTDQAGFSQLVVRFKVSPSALAVRLSVLGMIPPPMRDSWRRMSTAECYQAGGAMDRFLQEVQCAQVARLPFRLCSALVNAYVDGETTLRPLAALLDVDVDTLYELMDPAIAESPSGFPPDEGDLVFHP